MNIISPISSIMSTHLKTVNPEDSLATVKEIFDNHNIHHLPVVRFKEIVGLISKTDFMHFMRGYSQNETDRFVEHTRLNAWKVEEIMTKKLAKVDSKEPIRTALELFKINRFHALPVVDNDELVGILTTHDIISKLAVEPVRLEDYATK